MAATKRQIRKKDQRMAFYVFRLSMVFMLLASIAYWPPKAAVAGELDEPIFDSIREIKTPGHRRGRGPNLFASSDGRVFLSWQEQVGDNSFALRFSRWGNKSWLAPRTISTSAGWFINWADFPSMTAFPNGPIVAHWLKSTGESLYAYDINIVTSDDGGKSWGDVIVPHRDGAPSQHGFVSMLPGKDGKLLILWLDGRNFDSLDAIASGNKSAPNQMALRFATLDKAGVIGDQRILDVRTCSCCQTAFAATKKGAIVVYRDRTETEIRDISVLRYQGGIWSKPRTVHKDNWRIDGCPVNGPAVAAQNMNVAVAWFTEADDQPRVKVAFSDDGGETFNAPIRVDGGEPSGRVDVILLPSGAAIVSWVEMTSGGEDFYIRKVLPSGRRGKAKTLGFAKLDGIEGFPRMVRNGAKVYFAWTQAVAEAMIVRTAVAKLRHAD